MKTNVKGEFLCFGVLLRCNFCAFLDETIQIFSGRGPDIKDVWLDTFGAAAGILLVSAVRWTGELRAGNGPQEGQEGAGS